MNSTQLFKKFIMAGAISAVVAGCTGATVAKSEEVAPTLEVANKLVSATSKGKAKASMLVPGPEGMTGVIIESDGRKFLGWIPNNGKTLVVGALFDETGVNQTLEAMKKNNLIEPTVPKTAEPSAKSKSAGGMSAGQYLAAVSKAEGFTEGTNGPLIHAFIDLNCSFCNVLYSQIKPMIDQGKVRVHWVPTSFLKEDSLGKAAAVMLSSNPANALQEHESAFNPQTEEGGIHPVQPTKKVEIAIHANTDLLALGNGGQAATPTLVFQKKSGEVAIHPGMPQNMMALLSEAQ